MTASLGVRTLRGSLWSIVARLLTRSFDLVALVVFAHLLTPHDFGLVAIASTVVTIAEAAFDLPFGSVLTREAELRPSHLDTAFTLSVFKGLALTAISVGVAIPMAALYGDKRIGPVLVCLTLAPILRGLQSPGLTYLVREVRFGQLSVIEIVGKLIGLGAGVFVAVGFHSYWALVVTTVGTPLAMVVVSYVVRPHRPKLSLQEWNAFSDFLRWTSFSQILNTANWQCDRVVLGLWIGQADLGRYSLASNISVLPEQAAVKPLAAPLLSAFSQVSGELALLRRGYLLASVGVTSVCAPFVLIISALAGPLTSVVLGGGKWTEAAPLLRWLVLAPLFSFPYAPMPALAMALGRTKMFSTRSLLEFGAQIPLLIILTYTLGIKGALISRIVVSFYMMMISLDLVRRLIGFSVLDQLLQLRESLVAGAVTYLAVLEASAIISSRGASAQMAQLVIGSVVGLFTYVGVFCVVWSATHGLVALRSKEAVGRALMRRITALEGKMSSPSVL